GAEFTITKTGDKSFSKVITTNKEGIATATNLAFGDYVVTETKAPQGYEITAKPQNVIVNASNVTTVQALTFKDTPLSNGSISITKTNEAGTVKLEGAEFTITKDNDKTFKPLVLTTNANGIAKVENLKFGTYTITETKAPQGYEITAKAQKVVINAKDVTTVQALTFKDIAKTGSFTIVKEGTNKEKLAGAIFEVLGPNNYKKLVTTDKNGAIDLTRLEWGNYQVKEVKAPIGYNIDANSIKVVIDSTHLSYAKPFIFVDTKITGTVNIFKTNESGNALAGAVIEIENADGKVVFKGMTPENGTISIKLPFGSYTYKEVVAPKGYNINNSVGSFNITKENEVINKTIVDSKISVITDSKTKDHTVKKIHELPDTGLSEVFKTNVSNILFLLIVSIMGLLGYNFKRRN
ncbi:MAG: SpaA isopeptide-forming pilin-related protein, partial [Sarcina sp.]